MEESVLHQILVYVWLDILETNVKMVCSKVLHHQHAHVSYITFLKCKNIFTKMMKDVGIEVPKSIETRSKCSMHTDIGRG